jgi:hypothetical protein
VELESKEPPHRTFASLSDPLEGLVDVYSLIPANTERSTVYETDSRVFVKKYLFDEQDKGYRHFFLQLYKAVVRDDFRAKMTHVLAHFIQIEVFLCNSNKSLFVSLLSRTKLLRVR